jgi:acyl-CoA synthetase (AMP-forming)/AMP-acid ligase II
MLIATTDLIEFTTEMSAELQLSCVSLDLGSIHSPNLPQTSTLIERVTRQMLLEFSGTPPRPKRTTKDVGALIYTSGTSGKPKAVAVKAFLFCLTSTPLSIDLSNPKRYFPVRTYSCLPLFHATAFLNGLCYSVGTSGCFCLSKKFSASKFSQDLVESRATRMQYVGELCRYLVATPPSKYDKIHSCIVGNGNGLQKDIWNRFKERFNIHEIREIYRSTEGIAKFDNFNSGPAGAGKVGFFGPLRRKLEKGTYLVKYDTEKEDLYRHPKTGFCVLAELDEPGEAIGRIQSWELYPEYHKNPKATELKLVRNVFDTGDLFQRTGDLLVHDREGWIRFHDRTGDTFRWKGENVSAGEVRAFISEMPNVHDVSVYGVKLDR